MLKKRSWLFVPAYNQRFLDQCFRYPADVIILDLEDSVLDQYKNVARTNLFSFKIPPSASQEVIIRINPPATNFFKDDLALIKKVKATGVMIPKVADPATLKNVRKVLGPDIKIVPIIETLDGYFNASQILSAVSISEFAFGAEDFCSDANIVKGNLKENPLLLEVISNLSLIAKHLKLWFVDCVYTGYETQLHLERLREESSFTKKLGTDGKLAIHPSQIEIINNVYSISHAEIELAENIVERFHKLESGGSVIADDFVMKDLPSLKSCQKLLEKAKMLGYH